MKLSTTAKVIIFFLVIACIAQGIITLAENHKL